jgi:opacity protein-like surface antigen
MRSSSVKRGVLLFLAAVVLPPSAAAQQPAPRPRPAPAAAAPRVWIGINGGYQASTTEFEDSFTFTVNQETGRTRVTYPIEAGFTFDAGGGVRLWRDLGFGLAVSHFARDGVAATGSTVPHPFFLERDRQVDGEAGGLDRTETAIHIQAQYRLPLRGRLQILLMGGPSILQVNQSLVTAVNYSEEYPFDSATFTGVDSREVSGQKTGFNAGADVRWAITRQVGVGAMVRFTRAAVELDPVAGRTISVDAGGAQVGAGLRFAF